MKTQRIILLVACVAIIAGCGGATTETPAPVEVAVEEAPAVEAVVEVRNDVVYACDCGPDCECNSVAAAPGGARADPA